MNKKFLFTILFLLFLLNSCQYTPTSVNYRQMPEPHPDVNFVVLNENEINVLRGNVVIPYSSELNGVVIKEVRAFIDDDLMDSNYGDTGSLEIESTRVADGLHTLRLVMISTTNSGSLADLANAEFFVLTKEYQVQVFNAAVTPPNITNVYLDGHTLWIEWEKYEQPGFQKYELYNNSLKIADIYDRDSTECVDHSFVGDQSYFKVVTKAAGESFGYHLFDYYYCPTLLKPAEINNQNQMVLGWTRNQFDSAFSFYRLYRGNTIMAEINDINDTSYIDESPPFGGEQKYGIVVLPRIRGDQYPDWREITAPAIGTTFDYCPGYFFDYIPSDHKYYLYGNAQITVYDDDLNSLNTNMLNLGGGDDVTDMSSDGSLFYTIYNSVERTIVKIDPVTLQTGEVFNLQNIAGMNIGTLKGLSVSDNNFLVVSAERNDFKDFNYVFNLNRKKLIAYKQVTGGIFYFDVKISNDGNYVRAQTKLYRLEDTSLVYIGEVSPASIFSEDPGIIINISGNNVQLLNCTDLTIIKEIGINDDLSGASLDVDKAEGYTGLECPSAGNYYILDMQTVTIKKKISIINSGFNYNDKKLFGRNRVLQINF